MALLSAAPMRLEGVLCSLPLLVDGMAPQLGRPRTSDFSRCDYRAAEVKNTVVCRSASTGDCLIVGIKKSQRVPFPRGHDCRLTTACTNETHRNAWVRAYGRLASYLCVKPAPSKAILLR